MDSSVNSLVDVSRSSPWPGGAYDSEEAEAEAEAAEEAAEEEEEEGDADADGAAAEMRFWWCRGDGRGAWEAGDGAVEVEAQCGRWESEGVEVAAGAPPPAPSVVWRMHDAWCAEAPAGRRESAPCRRYRSPKFRERYEPSEKVEL